MDTELKEFWTEEFAPTNLEEMVLTSDIKDQFRRMLDSKTRFSCLLAGRPGIGKTTLANIIVKELGASVLFVPCGIEGTVATAQGKIKSFCESLSIEGRQKVVLLDELDSASGTQDNSMQKVLRNIISESPDTMFIATCNYVEKVIEPIRSRLGIVNLKFSARDLMTRLADILKAKDIGYDSDSLKKFVLSAIKMNYPDIRRIISILQSSCSSGELIVVEQTSTVDNSFMKELVEKCKTETDVLRLRQFYISNKGKIEDYLAFSSDLFNYLMDNGIVKDRNLILRISDSIYQMNLVIDREIVFFKIMTLLNMQFNR